MAIVAWGPPNLKGIKSFEQLFTPIIHSPKPAFLPSFSEIDDLSCNTSCMVLPGFLMDTLLIYSLITKRDACDIWTQLNDLDLHKFS